MHVRLGRHSETGRVGKRRAPRNHTGNLGQAAHTNEDIRYMSDDKLPNDGGKVKKKRLSITSTEHIFFFTSFHFLLSGFGNFANYLPEEIIVAIHVHGQMSPTAAKEKKNKK